MKKKLCAIFLLAITACTCLCAFTFDANSSVKSLTKPYITTYECNFARFGEEDLLEKYDYVRITILDDKEIEISYKKKNGKRKVHVCNYEYNDKTQQFEAEVGILGFKFKQATKIENGRFTISMPLLGRPLVMVFAS